MNAFSAARTVSEHVQTIHAEPGRVLPLLCPVREAEWLDGWSADVAYSASGVTEEDGVFLSRHAGEADPSVWVVTRRDLAAGEVEMVCFVPGVQVLHLTLRVTAAGPHRSRVAIRYVRTGLSDAGNAAIAASATPTRFGESMAHWEASMNHWLATGTRLAAC